jgi:hypothetical protein
LVRTYLPFVTRDLLDLRIGLGACIAGAADGYVEHAVGTHRRRPTRILSAVGQVVDDPLQFGQRTVVVDLGAAAYWG